MNRLTVAMDTPANLATSRIVVEVDFRVICTEPVNFPVVYLMFSICRVSAAYSAFREEFLNSWLIILHFNRDAVD